MPKRTGSGEVLIRPTVRTERNTQAQTSEEESVDHHSRSDGSRATSGSPRVEATPYLMREVPAIDVAVEELLAATPFWSLLIRAGYTWW